MPQDVKSVFGDCGGPLGFPMMSDVAREVEGVLSEQDDDIRSAFHAEINGHMVDGYCRLAFLPESPDYLELGNERTDLSLVMTESVDIDREVVLADGCNWKNFQRNPVVTFGHCTGQLPIGRALWIKRQKSSLPAKNGWTAKTRYHPRPDNWEGPWLPDGVWALIKSNSLPGKSIGFIPIEVRPVEQKDLEKRPDMARARWVIKKCMILEYAVGAIPRNHDSLVQAVGKLRTEGISGVEIALESMGLIVPATKALDTPKPTGSHTNESLNCPPAPTAERVEDVIDVNAVMSTALKGAGVGQMVKDEFGRMCGQIK